MVASDFISQSQMPTARTFEEPLKLIRERPTGLQSYKDPYFTTYVTHLLEAAVRHASDVNEGGLQVYTTMDPRMQDLAQDAVTWGVSQAQVSEGIGAQRRRRSWRSGRQTGEIRGNGRRRREFLARQSI